MARQSHAKSRSFQLPLLFLIAGRPSVYVYPVNDARVAGKKTARLGSPPERQVCVGIYVREKDYRSGYLSLVGYVYVEALLSVRRSHCNARRVEEARRRTDGYGHV